MNIVTKLRNLLRGNTSTTRRPIIPRAWREEASPDWQELDTPEPPRTVVSRYSTPLNLPHWVRPGTVITVPRAVYADKVRPLPPRPRPKPAPRPLSIGDVRMALARLMVMTEAAVTA